MKKKNKSDVSRRTFLKGAGAGALAAPILPAVLAGATVSAKASPAPGFPMIQTGAGRKRNVLFIMSDDCCDRLGVYGKTAAGNPVSKTPNLERFAKSAVRFDRAYCQYAWCSPSRSSLMTGYAPDTTKIYDLTSHFREALPDVLTLPQAFLKNDYFTARAGKIYHYGNPDQIGCSGLDDPPSWNETANPAGVDHVKEEALLTVFPRPRAPGRPGFVRTRVDHGFGGTTLAGCTNGWPGDGSPDAAQVPGGGGWGGAIALHESSSRQELHTDYLVADAAIAMLEKRRMQPDDPWFIGVGFYKPHVPWVVPSQYFDMNPLKDVRATPFNPDEMQMAPRWAYNSMTPNHGMTEQQCRQAIQAYYAAASFLDSNIGRVLDALQRLGLAENTTVVFCADHGWQLGEHGQWEKTTVFEAAARVPWMIGGAGVSAQGQACGRTVEHLDMYPTLVELCGLKGAPANLHGNSVVPLLSNPKAAWGRPAVSQIYRGAFRGALNRPPARGGNTPPARANNRAESMPPGGIMGYSLRTERYRYTFWKQGSEGEELYDYQVDPRELHNLAHDSGSAGLKAALRASLEKICMERGMANAPGALQA